MAAVARIPRAQETSAVRNKLGFTVAIISLK
jgi:hypothetical protein